MIKCNVFNTYDKDFPKHLKDVVHNYFCIVGFRHNDMYHSFDYDEIMKSYDEDYEFEKNDGELLEFFPTKEQLSELNDYLKSCGGYDIAYGILIFHGW